MPTRFEVERAVLASDLPTPSKCVMLVLAAWTDNATAAIRPENRKSLTEIARATSAGRSTVARCLDQLEQDGWIKRRQPSPEAQRLGAKTGYRLLVPPGGSPAEGLVPERDYLPVGSPAEGLPATSGNEGGSPAPGRGVVPQRDGKAITQREAQKHMRESFARFWDAYPRKTDKPKARKAFERAYKRAPADVIIAGAERYRDDPNRITSYTKYPEGWLNGDRWNDPPLPPRGESPNGKPARPAVPPRREWMVNRS